MKQYGFIEPEIKDEDYVLGAYTKLGAEVLQPDGQWGAYLPIFEAQAKNSIETYNCTAFATLNVIEALFRRKSEDKNFSDRYTGIMAGTYPPGNDPHKVIESIRKDAGLIDELLLPFSAELKTVDDYYSPKPMTKNLINRGHEFLQKWKIRHEWVTGKNQAIMEALKYSPLGVAVSAWSQDGKFYKRFGSDNHWSVIFGYKKDEYWLCFDSYDGGMKILDWDFGFKYVKRYSIEPNLDLSLYEQIIKLYTELVRLITIQISQLPKTEVTDEPALPNEPKTSLVKEFAEAIKIFEGWAPGTRSYRNSNPGNIKYTSYTKDLGATGRDDRNFCKFPSYEAGFKALCQFISDAANEKLRYYHNKDIYGFFSSYAPSSDNNHPRKYAEFVAKRIGVSPNTLLKEIV